MTTTAQRIGWDEPAAGRGWFWRHPDSRYCTGFYLDYGKDHYRSPHQFCRHGDCADCQPGNVLAVICDQHPDNDYRWFRSITDAKAYIEAA